MSNNDEIFEQEAADLKRLDKALGFDSDADDENSDESLKISIESTEGALPKGVPSADTPEAAKEEPQEKAAKAPAISKKTGKPKRQMTEKQRAQNLANLAKGRAKGLETRRRKAQLKKMAKLEKLTEEEKRIAEHIDKKRAKNKKHDELQEEINKLKAQLAEKNKSVDKVSNASETAKAKEEKAKEAPIPKAQKPKAQAKHTGGTEEKPKAASEAAKPKEKAKPKANAGLSQKQLLKIMRKLR